MIALLNDDALTPVALILFRVIAPEMGPAALPSHEGGATHHFGNQAHVPEL